MSTPLNSVYSGFSGGSGIQRYLIEAPVVHTSGSDSTVSTGSTAGTSSTTGLTVTDGTSSVIGVIVADSTALKIQASAGKAISLLNGSTEAVRISSAGKVSLGTTPGEENLSVLGNVNVNGFIKGLGIYDTSMVKGGGDSIPVVQCNNADLNSGQNVLWQHTTNQVPPTKSLLYIESKGVATTPSYERLIIGADRAGTRVLNLNPGGKVAVGGDYAASEVTSTLDVGGAMTVRGSILPDVTNTRNIGSSTLKFSSIYGSNIVDTIATRGSGSAIPFSSSTGVGLNSGQNVLWNHTTNEAVPTNFQLLIESKGVNSTAPAVERLQIGAYRDGYRNVHLQPAGRVMIGGDYSAITPTTTLDVGGTMTVRGTTTCQTIYPDTNGSRDIGSFDYKFNTLWGQNMYIHKGLTPSFYIHQSGYAYNPATDTDCGILQFGTDCSTSAINLAPNKYAQIKAVTRGGSSYYTPSLYFCTKPDVGTAITTRMVITENGNVGIGTTTPSTTLDIRGSTTSLALQVLAPPEAYNVSVAAGSSKNIYFPKGTVMNVANQAGVAASGTLIDIGAYSNIYNTNCYLGAVAGTTENGPANFVIGRRTGDTAWAESFRINTAGCVCVGTNAGTAGSILDVNGVSTFRGHVLPGTTAFTLGSATARWSELFCTNGVINTSDLNEKTSIVPLAPADSLTTLLKLHPVSYKWKENSHDRTHTGFISQQVEEDVGVDVAHDWGFFIKSPGLAEDVLDEEGKVVDVIQHPDTYGLRYTELISPLVGAVQCLAQRVESLESAGENKRKQYEVVLEEQRTAMEQYQQEITSLNDRLAVIENALKTMEFIN